MSLLMQALKKAERAKLNGLQETEPDKPSAAFDDILELAPLEAPAPQPELTLELEPAAPAAQAAAPLEFASAAPAPAPAPASGPAADPGPAATGPAGTPPVQPAQARAASGAAPGKRAGAETGAAAGAAARARAAAAAPAVRVALDPARLRVIVLAAVAALIAVVFAYVYWHAVYSRPASKLPMVPMPPLNAPVANGAAVVLAPAELAPEPAPAEASDSRLQALQARLDQQERELAAVQQLARNQHAAARGPETLAPLAAPDNGDIRVRRNSKLAQLNPGLQNGYLALKDGDLGSARQQYEAVLRQEPNNRDALLGMAALALRQNQGQQAAAVYGRLLELDPQDPDALAGLIGLHQGEPGQNEIRLKSLLQQHPDSAPLLFALGNLYAGQGRWPEAQPVFFRAYVAAPDNADYAFNLAVGLDRLNQGKLALGYYQRALTLAERGAASFERAPARRRVQELGGN